MTDLADRLTLSGEVHYFRLARADWPSRLQAAVDAGLDTIATYVPWLVHELPDGSVDLDGHTCPELDLGAFLDLCATYGLDVVARPGPFVMAELKNEGLPHRVLREHPEIRTPGWRGVLPAETIVDYLHPSYLAECRRWYEAVIPLLAARSRPHGGPVVAIQLDNEVGMLPWVANSPDLSERTVAELVGWLADRYGADGARRRYGLDPADPAAWVPLVRDPGDPVALRLHRDLGMFTRERYARYIRWLRDTARELGADVPFCVNVHGTWDGSAAPFPIGISQLYRTWSSTPDVFPGADYYIGDLTLDTLPGLWAANAFLAASTPPGRPFGSLEMEVGSGDYGEALDIASGPEGAPLRIRLCVAQGSRLINEYLFAGGRNAPLRTPVGDGNDRIAFTGERHGFAAPISPEGTRSPSWPALADATRALAGSSALLGAVRPESAPISLAFVPDHYLTEYRSPGSAAERRLVAELGRFRGSGPREVMTRALVLLGCAPDAVDVQDRPPDPARTPALALAPTPFLDRPVQRALVAYVQAGGRLLLAGPVPVQDLEGEPATDLVDALGVTATDRVDRSPRYFPSVAPVSDDLRDAGMVEVAVGFLQGLRATAPGSEVLAADVATGAPCVLDVPCGAGRVVVVAADLPCDLRVWRALTARLGVRPVVEPRADVPGVVTVPTATPDGQRLLHVLNVSPWPARVHLDRDGAPTFGGRALDVPARTGILLSENLTVPGGRLQWTDADVVGITHGPLTTTVRLRPGPTGGRAELQTAAQVDVDHGTLARHGTQVSVDLPAEATRQLVVTVTVHADGE